MSRQRREDQLLSDFLAHHGQRVENRMPKSIGYFLEEARRELDLVEQAETTTEWRVHMQEWAQLIQAQVEAITENVRRYGRW